MENVKAKQKDDSSRPVAFFLPKEPVNVLNNNRYIPLCNCRLHYPI